MKSLILVATDDLRLKRAIEAVALAESAVCFGIAQGDHLVERVRSFNPFMLIADLSSETSEWIFKHASEIKVVRHNFPMVACVAESQESQRLRAQYAGFDHVLGKRQFLKKLPEIIRRYLR